MIKGYVMNISGLRDAALYDMAWLKVGEERRKKVNKCKNDADKIRSLGAGILLLHALENKEFGTQNMELIEGSLVNILSGLSQRKEMKIHYGEQGKPYLDEEGLFFSLSHSGDYVLCAISDQEVGADIQQLREQRQDKIDRIAKKIMADAEYTIWNELPQQKKVRDFYRLWSCKESFVKFTGEGLSRPLNSIIVDKEHYLVFDEIEGYVVAITTEG